MSQKIKRMFLILSFFIIATSVVMAQKVGFKTNFAYWATTTPNLGAEFALGKKTTLELAGGLNLFAFSQNKKFRHWLVQPELRLWTCEVFNGHFFGLHGHGSQFNVGGWDIPVGRLSVFKEHRYEGYLYGGGVSYGYQWVLSPRWNFEASLGGGFARIHYEKYPCATCGTKLDEGTTNYWGVTKAALSIIYFIK